MMRKAKTIWLQLSETSSHIVTKSKQANQAYETTAENFLFVDDCIFVRQSARKPVQLKFWLPYTK